MYGVDADHVSAIGKCALIALNDERDDRPLSCVVLPTVSAPRPSDLVCSLRQVGGRHMAASEEETWKMVASGGAARDSGSSAITFPTSGNDS